MIIPRNFVCILFGRVYYYVHIIVHMVTWVCVYFIAVLCVSQCMAFQGGQKSQVKLNIYKCDKRYINF